MPERVEVVVIVESVLVRGEYVCLAGLPDAVITGGLNVEAIVEVHAAAE
jgi:hypothetical protein